MNNFYFSTDCEFSQDGWAFHGSEDELDTKLAEHAECMKHGLRVEDLESAWEANDYRAALEVLDLDDLESAKETELNEACILAKKWGCEQAEAALSAEMKIRDRDLEIKVAVNGLQYLINVDGRKIDIYTDGGSSWTWAGSGKWDGSVVDCAADLGSEVYDAIDAAIESAID